MPNTHKRQPPSPRASNGSAAAPAAAAAPAPADAPAAEPQAQPASQAPAQAQPETSKPAPPAESPKRAVEGLAIAELKEMSIQKLTQVAKDLNVAGATGMRKQELIFQILQGADRAERAHLLGRRARSAAGRLRLPARARLQLPAGPGRHLRLAVADPQVRPADRRHRVGPDPAAEGRGALLRADQGRGRQLRAARPGPRQALLREPDAALSAGAVQARDRRRQPVGAASWT